MPKQTSLHRRHTQHKLRKLRCSVVHPCLSYQRAERTSNGGVQKEPVRTCKAMAPQRNIETGGHLRGNINMELLTTVLRVRRLLAVWFLPARSARGLEV